jgi:hypothetical protein
MKRGKRYEETMNNLDLQAPANPGYLMPGEHRVTLKTALVKTLARVRDLESPSFVQIFCLDGYEVATSEGFIEKVDPNDPYVTALYRITAAGPGISFAA